MMNQHVQSGSSSGCGGDAAMMHVKMETVVDEQNHATAFVLGCSQEESSAPGCEEDSAAHAYATYTEAGEACSPPAAAANSLDLMADAAATNTILLSSEKTFAHSSDFCSKAVMHLIEAVGRRWGLYETRERSQLFQSVQDEMAAQGYVLPVEKIRRKWNNLIVTYKRVKDRSRETGHAKTSWEFFDLMDATLCDTVGVQVMHSSKSKTTKGSVPPAKIAAKPHDGSEPGGAPYGDFTALAVVDRSMTHAATAGAHDVNNEIGSAVATVPSVTSVSLETTAAPELKPLVLLNGDIVTASVLSPCPSLVSSPYAAETLPPPGPSHSFELTTGNNVHHHHPRVKIRSGGARLKAPLLRSAGRRGGGGGGGGQEGQAPPPLQPPPPQRSNHNIHTLSSSSSAASLTSTFSLRSPFPTSSYDASRTDGQMDAAAAELGGGSTSSSALLQELLRRQEERAYLEEAAGRRAEARERRRERREVRMAESLGRMATALELLSSKQDTVIALLQRLAERK